MIKRIGWPLLACLTLTSLKAIAAATPTASAGQTVDFDNYGIMINGSNFDASSYVDIRSMTGSNILLSVMPPNITYLPGTVTDTLSFRINDPTIQGILASQGLRFYVVSPTAGYQFAGPVTVTRGSPSFLAQPAAFHSIYFQPFLDSFWASLADDSGSPSPRQQMVWSINNELKAIRSSGIDTISVPLTDNDTFVSQYGGGFTYDPVNHPAAQRAVAQEILLRIAAANDLKVIFVIEFTTYRESSDGCASWDGLADQYDVTPSTNGALNFIHALIDPAAFYGHQTTTELSTIGLTDGPIGSYNNDPRVIGFILAPELNPDVISSQGVATQQYFFNKYWNWFYNLVHYNGSNTAFAGTYLIGSPNSPGAGRMVSTIKKFKSWFAPATGNIEPDLVGIEGYGGSGYPLQNLSSDLNFMLNALMDADTADFPGDFAIPPSKTFIGEANTNEPANPYINQYYQYLQQIISKRVMAGIQIFASDSLSSGSPLAPSNYGFDLFQSNVTPSGTKVFGSTLPAGMLWHSESLSTSYADPTTYVGYADNFSTDWGFISYTNPTPKGYWYGQAIANFTNGRNVVAYAHPNPMAGNASHLASTTIYWDSTEMPAVTAVEIHLGSPDGPVVTSGGAAGNFTTGLVVADGTIFFVQDVSGNKPRTPENTLSQIYANVQ